MSRFECREYCCEMNEPLTNTCSTDCSCDYKPKPSAPKVNNFTWYWNSHVSGWKMYGVWIKQKVFIGVSITSKRS